MREGAERSWVVAKNKVHCDLTTNSFESYIRDLAVENTDNYWVLNNDLSSEFLMFYIGLSSSVTTFGGGAEWR